MHSAFGLVTPECPGDAYPTPRLPERRLWFIDMRVISK